MKFSKQVLSVLMLYPILMLSACTLAQQQAVVTDIQKFLPAVTNVADAVCAFVPGAPACLGGVAAVTASANILVTALSNYYAAKAAGTVPPSIWQDLTTAIATFENDASNILAAVHVVDSAHQAEIMALAAAAQVLLAIVETLLPSGSVTAGKFLAFAPAFPFKLSAWVADYNVKVAACQQYMPRNVSLKKVHMHNAVVRYLSFGVAK